MGYQILKSEVSGSRIVDYSQLLSDVYIKTTKLTPRYLEWQYRQNPMGTAVGFDAFYEDQLAAHYVTIPVVYSIQGKKSKGLLAINTVTHPKHQGKGLFTTLANRTFEEGKKLGYEFIIGVANQNSTYGYLNKLQFKFISPLEVKIGVGKMEIYDSTNYLVQPHWSKEALQWRLSNPEIPYYVNNNIILAPTNKYWIYAQLKQHKKKLSMPVELKKKKALIKIWIGLSRATKSRGLFIDFPEKLKPSPLNLIFKDLKGNLPEFQKEDIFFELIDFDAY